VSPLQNWLSSSSTLPSYKPAFELQISEHSFDTSLLGNTNFALRMRFDIVATVISAFASTVVAIPSPRADSHAVAPRAETCKCHVQSGTSFRCQLANSVSYVLSHHFLQ